MTEEYGSQREYMEWVSEPAKERADEIEKSLRIAFKNFIELKEVEIILFSQMSANDLAKSLLNYPIVLKPLLASCNIGARAIERDLGLKNVDTYSPRLGRDTAMQIAGYIKPFLPPYIEIPALTRIDRIYFIDKEVRKSKGRWEKDIVGTLNRLSGNRFKKRKFISMGEEFELDAAYPKTGDISIGIDIKRIEARRDIHKRCDEIVNKATKLKGSFPKTKFVAIIYYPFLDEHVNIQNRLKSEKIDLVVFASQSKENIINGCKMLLSTLGIKKIVTNLEAYDG